MLLTFRLSRLERLEAVGAYKLRFRGYSPKTPCPPVNLPRVGLINSEAKFSSVRTACGSHVAIIPYFFF